MSFFFLIKIIQHRSRRSGSGGIQGVYAVDVKPREGVVVTQKVDKVSDGGIHSYGGRRLFAVQDVECVDLGEAVAVDRHGGYNGDNKTDAGVLKCFLDTAVDDPVDGRRFGAGGLTRWFDGEQDAIGGDWTGIPGMARYCGLQATRRRRTSS
jgi:hypothetical protein